MRQSVFSGVEQTIALFLVQIIFNVFGQNVNSNMIVASLRYDQIGIAFGGFDKLLMHRFYGLFVAFHHFIYRSAPLYDVAVDDAYEAVVGVGIHKHFEIHHFAKFRIAQHEYSFHYHHVARIHCYCFVSAGTGEVGVDGLFY